MTLTFGRNRMIATAMPSQPRCLRNLFWKSNVRARYTIFVTVMKSGVSKQTFIDSHGMELLSRSLLIIWHRGSDKARRLYAPVLPKHLAHSVNSRDCILDNVSLIEVGRFRCKRAIARARLIFRLSTLATRDRARVGPKIGGVTFPHIEDNSMKSSLRHSAARLEVGAPTLRHTLAKRLLAQIESGALAPGDRLPSLNDLSAQHEVSNITARGALRELIAAGWVQSRPRSGYFVRPKSPKTATPQTESLKSEAVIALIVPASDHIFFAAMVQGVMRASQAAGYRLIIGNTHEDAHEEARQLHDLAPRVAGLLVAPTTLEGDDARYTPLVEQGVPLVFIDRYSEGVRAPHVTSDNETGAYLATRHLLETGCRRVYFVADNQASSMHERLRGYKRALSESGLRFKDEYLRYLPHINVAGYTLTREILSEREHGEPNNRERWGLFTSHDGVARHCYLALKEAGLRIPDDVAVVGFDDTYASLLDPPLTTVRQDLAGMAARAVQLLQQSIENRAHRDLSSVQLPTQLIIRGSSDPLRHFSVADVLEMSSSNSELTAPMAPARAQ